MNSPKRPVASRQSRPFGVALPYAGTGQATDQPILHRAEWLVPVASPPVQNGGVLVRGGHILAAGPYAEVNAVSPALTPEVDHGSSALLPGLVNAHTHLELSGLRGMIELPQDSFSEWLKKLLALRPLMTQEFLHEGLNRGQQQLVAGGCCLCGDITNGACLKPARLNEYRGLPSDAHVRIPGVGSTTDPATPGTEHSGLIIHHSSFIIHHSPFSRQVFLEVLGFDRADLAEALNGDPAELLESVSVSDMPPSLAAHSPYSTAGAVIREAKGWCRAKGLRFSIHVAEHPEEIEFLEHGTGFCREILEDLGRWTPRWTAPQASPVRYLDQLQVLDAETLLVHVVHLTDADWELVLRNNCPVCFCPRSNRNLNVGEPDIAKALRYGLVTALGTDSLASNSDLDLFAEAAHVVDHYSAVSPEAALGMITLGGARALGQERYFGAVAPGRLAELITIFLPAPLPNKELFETIIEQGNKGAWQWVHHPANGCDWAKSAI
jgi:aminodeoxyfutalosine deaminase